MKNKNDVLTNKIQFWVTAELKAGMSAASNQHCINWSRFIRNEIQSKLNELNIQRASVKQ